eukprot:1177869-Prorocentrum_minimum.AAC.3
MSESSLLFENPKQTRAVISYISCILAVSGRRTRKTKQYYSHDGPIRRRKRGYVLTMDQSDAGIVDLPRYMSTRVLVGSQTLVVRERGGILYVWVTVTNAACRLLQPAGAWFQSPPKGQRMSTESREVAESPDLPDYQKLGRQNSAPVSPVVRAKLHDRFFKSVSARIPLGPPRTPSDPYLCPPYRLSCAPSCKTGSSNRRAPPRPGPGQRRYIFSLPFRDWCPLRAYSLSPSASGARYGYILSPLPRVVPVTGLFSLPFREWCPLRAYSLSPSAIGVSLCSACAFPRRREAVCVVVYATASEASRLHLRRAGHRRFLTMI